MGSPKIIRGAADCNIMTETDREDRKQVYEIAYLIAGVPEERVAAEADAVRKLVSDAGASVLAEGAPQPERAGLRHAQEDPFRLIRQVRGSQFRLDQVRARFGQDRGLEEGRGIAAVGPAHFGRVRYRENTYLGKRSPATASFMKRPMSAGTERAKSPDYKDAAPAARLPRPFPPPRPP